MEAQVGHLYRHGNRKVLAMTAGAVVRVRKLEPQEPAGLGRAYVVSAHKLTPLPMKYFRGAVPHG